VNIAHDLRAPLTYIIGYLSFISFVGAMNRKAAEVGAASG
jgi:signal transduction histidine kinase